MKIFKKFLLVFSAVFVVFVFFGTIFFLNVFNIKKDSKALVYFPGSQISFLAKLAISPTDRMRGLMYYKNLPENSGMLFISPAEDKQSFWMKNTFISLDIIFINSDKKIVDIKKNFLPCRSEKCETYTSIAPAKYVLEINAGLVDKNKINIGDQIIIK